jgi:hypothetical protein
MNLLTKKNDEGIRKELYRRLGWNYEGNSEMERKSQK